jgi:hypothetical protein
VKLLVTNPGKLGARLLPKLAHQGVTGRVLHRRAVLDLPAGWEPEEITYLRLVRQRGGEA